MTAGGVSRSRLMDHLRALTSEVRISGSPEEARAFDYLESTLVGWGFQVNRYASDSLIGYPLAASLVVTNASGETFSIVCNGYSLSPSTTADGVEGELIDAGSGAPSDYAGLDVEGKIVLSDGLAMPAKAMAARAAGAIGQIHINDENIHEMCISPVWGTPIPETAGLLPTVPSVGVTAEDGRLLLDLVRTGPVRAKLSTTTVKNWIPIPTLTAELPASQSDQFVLFSGHVDSWHLGVMDNGTANATQLEVAELMAAQRSDLQRGLRLAFWSGHSHGRYASSTWYADTFWQEIHDRCVCHVNVDSVGAKGAVILDEAPSMAETFAFGADVMRSTVNGGLNYRRISRSSDQSFWGHGVPSLWASLSEQAIDDSPTSQALGALLGGGKTGGLGWWWHTTEDTLDKIDPALLERDALIYAETLSRLCTLDRLPFDAAAGAREMAEAIGGYADRAGSSFDLSRTADLASAVARTIAERTSAETGNSPFNALTMSVIKTLIPVNYTRSGPFGHDLALSAPPVPGLSDAPRLASIAPDSDEFRFLRTRLIRERNRIESALQTAAAAVS